MSIPELIANGSRSNDSVLLEEINKCEARIIELEQQKAELVDACNQAWQYLNRVCGPEYLITKTLYDALCKSEIKP